MTQKVQLSSPRPLALNGNSNLRKSMVAEASEKHVITQPLFQDNLKMRDSEETKTHSLTKLFFDAIKKGDVQTVQTCLNQGVDVNKKYGNLEDTPHYNNFIISQTSIIPSFFSPIQMGVTPLYLAASTGRTAIVELLLTHGAKTDLYENGEVTPLMVAAQKGYKNIVNLLLKSGAPADHTTEDGSTALHLCCEAGHHSIVKLLIDKANINCADNDGETPLIVATHHRHFRVVEILLKRGAKVNQEKPNGVTAIFLAAQQGDMSIAECLINFGADPHKIRKTDQRNSIQIAEAFEHKTVAEFLAKKTVKS